MLIFLGGTCGNNNWREEFLNQAVKNGLDENIFFNPVVPNWTLECQEAEDKAKELADFKIFYLADPKEEGNALSAYSMVEATMALYDDPERTIVVFDQDGITGHALKAMKKTEKDLRKAFPDAPIFSSMEEVIDSIKSGI